MTSLNFDYETKSDVDLTQVGLDVYASHPSTRVIFCSYSFDKNPVPKLWDVESGLPFPRELREAIADPEVKKKAFNAQFERIISKRVLKIDTPIRNWRCSMVGAYLLSFSGGLGDIARQIGLPADKQKDKRGKELIRLFSMPQRVTKSQPHLWRNGKTDPDQYREFGEYCIQDTVAEMAVEKRLEPFYIPESEWLLYELDQKINDRGLPVDMQYVENAIWMAAKRKKELLEELRDLTGLANPNSGAQMLPWLQARGYPFSDLVKDTVKKVLKESRDSLEPDAVSALLLRQNASRTSVAKYDAFYKSSGYSEDEFERWFRFAFQMAGATRTARWAGRRIQAQNLPRTPGEIEQLWKLAMTTNYIRNGDYEGLGFMVGEPMTALVGCIRSAIRAPKGRVLRVCDLSSIETCVIAWLSRCVRLLKVIQNGYDPYKDFGVILYKGVYAAFGTPEYEAAYAEVSKKERTNSKPAVLGCGYRLGGGDLMKGKRTGLWGYAENMGVDLTQSESLRAVNAYRENYAEVPALWKAYEVAVAKALRSRVPVREGPLVFVYQKPFLKVVLPDGRPLYYFQPKMLRKEFSKSKGRDEDGNEILETWNKLSFTYMGQNQKSGKWERIYSHGGKLVENFVQAIARNILKEGLLDADNEGFDLVGHVHDEILACEDEDDDYHTVELLGDCMTRARSWAEGLPLGYGGWQNPFYIKD